MPDTDSQAIEAWLLSFVRADAPRGERARDAAAALFAELGDPQDRVRAVHVVGTAGKGTVARLVADTLRRRGDTVGLHLSPHVHDIRERFTVTDDLPDWSAVRAAGREVEAAVGRLAAPPTFFAVTAAMATVLARQANTDWLVVEAGIGGRVDATNTFGRADVLTVVTAIGLDHQDVLGDTVEAIAAEKAAVLAGRSHAVLGPQPDDAAARVVAAVAAAESVELVQVAPTGDWRTDAEATAAAAIAALVPDAPTPVFVPQPGRDERLALEGTTWILDGAHNPMKLAALRAPLLHEPGPRVGLVALGAGKALEASVAAIAPALDRVVTVGFGPPPGDPGPRSHPATDVATAFEQAGVTADAATDAAEAVALAKTNEPATVVVTGSFLHLTAVREVLQGG